MKDPQREARRWLAEAEEDLKVAAALTRNFPARACFHAQQAGEKALKAILYATGERIVKTHSLGELGDAVEAASPGYKGLRPEVTKLDRYYIPTRYPNGLPQGGLPSESFDADDARSAIATAQKAVDHALGFIEERFGS